MKPYMSKLAFFIVSSGLFALSYVESSNGLETPALDGGPVEVELADVNLDGNPDLVSVGDHGSPYVNTQEHGIMVWFGDGTGNWAVYQTGNFGYGGVAVGDVDNDGYPDVGYAVHHNWGSGDFGDQLIEVALGDGSGQNWTPYDDGLASNGEEWGMFGIDFADVDSDGDLDLGANSFGCCDGLHIYFNLGDGTWTQSWGFNGGNSGEYFVFGDINGDGNPDFVAEREDNVVYASDGVGNFLSADGNLPGGIGGLDLGDVNNDGRDDISFCNVSGGVEVWLYGEDGNWVPASDGLPGSGDFSLTQLYDMDHDGFADLVAFEPGTVKVWLGNGGSSWSQAAAIAVPNGGSPIFLRVGGDGDHNGYPDIILVDREGSFWNYRNHLRFFRESSDPDELEIFPYTPGPGRKLKGGSVRFIRWTSEVPGDGSYVKLELSVSGPDGPFVSIADSLSDNGVYQWIVPQVNSSNCFIRYTLISGTDTVSALSRGAFTIMSSTGIGEAGGEPIPGGFLEVYPARGGLWISYSVRKDGRIELFSAQGRSLGVIAHSLRGKGVFFWDAVREGECLPSGIYFLGLRDGGNFFVKKFFWFRLKEGSLK